MALMVSVYYGILCCHSSMCKMLELAIQGDVCKGLDGVIKIEETHIKKKKLWIPRVSMEVHICTHLSVCVGKHFGWGEDYFSSMNYA